MAHYAFLNGDNVVTEVIVGKDEDDLDSDVNDWEQWYGNFRGQRCLRTSYNTHGNVHSGGGTPFRYNYAVIGGTYDDEKDGFIPPKPLGCDSWLLDEATLLWVPPVPHPDDGTPYYWSDESGGWISFGE